MCQQRHHYSHAIHTTKCFQLRRTQSGKDPLWEYLTVHRRTLPDRPPTGRGHLRRSPYRRCRHTEIRSRPRHHLEYTHPARRWLLRDASTRPHRCSRRHRHPKRHDHHRLDQVRQHHRSFGRAHLRNHLERLDWSNSPGRCNLHLQANRHRLDLLSWYCCPLPCPAKNYRRYPTRSRCRPAQFVDAPCPLPPEGNRPTKGEETQQEGRTCAWSTPMYCYRDLPSDATAARHGRHVELIVLGQAHLDRYQQPRRDGDP